jgi:transcriptional regulator with XRE-family HTH domain
MADRVFVPPDVELGEVVREQRVSRGWTQVELARRACVGEETVRGLELGRKTPHQLTLAAIALALGMTVHELRECARARREAS